MRYMKLHICHVFSLPLLLGILFIPVMTGKVSASSAENILNLYYDDRYVFSSDIKDVVIVQVASNDAHTGEKQKEIILADGSRKIICTGCGEIQVTLANGEKWNVNIAPAPISMFIAAGQSNAEGRPCRIEDLADYQEQWVVNEEGQVYSTYGPSDEYDQDMYKEVAWYEDTENIGQLTAENADHFVPVSLTDNTQNTKYNRTDRLTDSPDAAGKGGMDGAFAYRWHHLTGEKVWLINAAHHGSKIETWDPQSRKHENYDEALALVGASQNLLQEEINAGHYILKHVMILWCQGENNRNMKSNVYMQTLDRILTGFQSELPYPPEALGMLMVRAALDPRSTEDLSMSGPRRAQYALAISNKKKYQDIVLASHIEELWATDEGVQAYFIDQYEDEKTFLSAYPTRGKNYHMPSTVDDVHAAIHFTQLAQNEIGFDAANNLYYTLISPDDLPDIDAGMLITSEDGFADCTGSTFRRRIGERLPLAVKVFPAYLSKRVKMEIRGDAKYNFGSFILNGGSKATITFLLDDYAAAEVILEAGEY